MFSHQTLFNAPSVILKREKLGKTDQILEKEFENFNLKICISAEILETYLSFEIKIRVNWIQNEITGLTRILKEDS